MGSCYSTSRLNSSKDAASMQRTNSGHVTSDRPLSPSSQTSASNKQDIKARSQQANVAGDRENGISNINGKVKESKSGSPDVVASGSEQQTTVLQNGFLPHSAIAHNHPLTGSELQKAAAAAPVSDPEVAIEAIVQQQNQQTQVAKHTGQQPDAIDSHVSPADVPCAAFLGGSAFEGPQPEIVSQRKEEAVQEVLRGAAYRSDIWGPPRPASQNERMQTLTKIKATLVGKRTDPDVDNILKLALKLFGFDSAVVALVADKSFKIQDAQGALAGNVGLELPWLAGICGYVLEPSHHEVLVVEDMTLDARFNSEPRLGFAGFYCGAPLVAADGHRLGTLCLGHSKPGTIDTHQVNILCNMAELVSRVIEKAWADSIRAASLGQLSRSLAAYLRPLLVLRIVNAQGASLEASVHDGGNNWTIDFANQQASELMGLSEGKNTAPFWELVSSGMRSQAPWTPFTAAIQSSTCFSATFRLSADKARQQDRLWIFEFRPAGREAIDAETQLIGVPSWLPDGSRVRKEAQLFFVEIAPAGCHSSTSSSAKRTLSTSNSSNNSSSLVPAVIPACFEGLQLGTLLGKGGYGRVYRGYYNHMPVAVKVIDTTKVRRNEAGEPLEAIMTGHRKHPHILQTIGWTVTTKLPESAAYPYIIDDRDNGSQTWLLLEYCDKPCVQDAIDRGMFREGGPYQTNPPSMSAICWTAYEIACAMAALHNHGVVHSDLKGGNVLLKSASNDRGFEAKVADFGMARQMGIEERLHTNQYGTVTHCSPELLLHSTVSKASDVWAFGVMMWELLHGTRAWAGLSHAQIRQAVSTQRLTFDKARSLRLPANDVYFQLAEACMSPEPADRPSFADMHLVLKTAAQAWDKLKLGPNNGAQPKSLEDDNCYRCIGCD